MFFEKGSEESVACRWRSTQVREPTLALKPRADVTRNPKQGYQSVAPQKDLRSPKILKKTHKQINKKLTAFASVVAVLLAHCVEERGVYARDTVHRHPVRRVDLQLPHRYRHRVLHVRVPVRRKDGSTRGVVLCQYELNEWEKNDAINCKWQIIINRKGR